MSFAPTQIDPATCGSQVKGLLRKTVAMSTGRFKRNSTPSMTQVTICTGRGEGGMNAMNRPTANARVTLCLWNVQQPRSSTSVLKGLKHQSFSSVWRSGVMRFSQRCMNCGGLPRGHYAVFEGSATVIHDRPSNQRVRFRPMAVSEPSAVKYHARQICT